MPCYYMTFLFPGAWNFAYFVRASNGDAWSDRQTVLLRPYRLLGTCPLAPSYSTTVEGVWLTNTNNTGGGAASGDDEDLGPTIDYPDCPNFENYATVDDLINEENFATVIASISIPEYCVNTYMSARSRGP